MIKINLVPGNILAKAHQRQQMLQIAAAGVLIAAGLVMASLSHLYKLNSLHSRLAVDQIKLKELEKIEQAYEDLQNKEKAVRARLDVVSGLLKGRTLYPVFMSRFVETVPEGVRVKSLTAKGGGSSGGAIAVTAIAEARTNEDIADWIKKMEDSGKFSAVELTGGVVATVTTDQKSIAFSLQTNYSP